MLIVSDFAVRYNRANFLSPYVEVAPGDSGTTPEECCLVVWGRNLSTQSKGKKGNERNDLRTLRCEEPGGIGVLQSMRNGFCGSSIGSACSGNSVTVSGVCVTGRISGVRPRSKSGRNQHQVGLRAGCGLAGYGMDLLICGLHRTRPGCGGGLCRKERYRRFSCGTSSTSGYKLGQDCLLRKYRVGGPGASGAFHVDDPGLRGGMRPLDVQIRHRVQAQDRATTDIGREQPAANRE
jgi:hypothetical protein